VAPIASCDDLEAQIPAQENRFDMLRVIERLIDADTPSRSRRCSRGN
jgi:hypothetical protein